MFTQINFSGKWTVEVISKNANFDIRFDIRGTAPITGQGPHMGVVGTSVPVDGPDWHIAFEWSKTNEFLWNACEARKLSADFLLDKGLVVTIGAHRDIPAEASHAFDELVVRLRNTDPQLNPFVPITHPDFTYKRRIKTVPGTAAGVGPIPVVKPVRKPN
jgi:hypothetical protein